MEKVRFALVGVGNMGKEHIKYMSKSDYAEVVSVCDIDRTTGEAIAKQYGAKFYDNHEDCFKAGGIEAVLVATPHYSHPTIAIAAMKRGIHVLCEKPVAVTVSEADRMAKAAAKTGVKYGIMFQRRTKPAIIKAKEILASGAIGEIWRTLIVETEWYRTQAYYNSGGWRGTWAGEGGGVLMNQAPHSLDMFTWLTGMPAKVEGRVATLQRKIEVEDTASALLTYANGGTGYLMTSTWEYPGESRMRVVGSQGILEIEGQQKLRLAKTTPAAMEFAMTTKEIWGSPKSEWTEVPVEEKPWGHASITENFAKAIREGAELIAPGAEGVKSLELANAIVLSSYTGKEVKLPLKRKAMDDLVAKMVRKFKAKK